MSEMRRTDRDAVQSDRRRIWGAIYAAHLKAAPSGGGFTRLQLDWLESVVLQRDESVLVKARR